MNELVFEVTQEADGGYVAECLTETIVTEGDDWNQLSANVPEATRGYFFDSEDKMPARIRDEVHADRWDAQIESDALAGKFDVIAQRVRANHEAGLSTPL